MKFLSNKKIVFIVFVLIIIILGYTLISKNTYQKASSPIEELLWQSTLNKENSCIFQKSNYLYAVTELEKAEQENSILREALGIGLGEKYDLLLANINSKNSFEEVITINKGLDSGVEEGMIVLTSENALVGKIINVYDNFSEVMLLTDKDSAIDVKILGKDEIAIVNGDGKSLVFDFVSKESNIHNGDIFVTSGISSDFEEGILVGEVTEVQNIAQEAEEQGEAIPFFELRDLRQVFIVLDVK
jgi:rod shape-determining protein MreC